MEAKSEMAETLRRMGWPSDEPDEDVLHRFKYDEPGDGWKLSGRTGSGAPTLPRIGTRTRRRRK